MKDLLPYLVIGVTTGSLYGLSGMGLVITYKTSGLLNFAHGATCAAAAYGYYAFREQHDLPFALCALLVLLLFGVVGGLVLERVSMLLAGTTVAYRIVGTVGLLVALQAGCQLAFGAEALSLTPIFSQSEVMQLGGVRITVENLIDVAVGVVAAIGLAVVFGRTRIGAEMRAVVDDPQLLDLTGRSPQSVRRTSWIIGSSFAAASGVMLASVQNQIDINVLSLVIIAAFGAAAIGRFASIPWTFVGGLAIGLVQKVASKQVADFPSLQGLDINMPFIVLFVVLLCVPKRSLVEVGRQVKAAALPSPTMPGSIRAVAWGVALVGAVAVPEIVGSKLPAWSVGVSQVTLFASLGLLVRVSGQISLCHVAFAAIGAATAGHSIGGGVPWGIAVLLAGLVCVPVAAMVSVPAIRLSGIYLGLATLGFGIFVAQYAYGKDWFFGTQLTVPRPHWAGLESDQRYYYLLVGIAVLSLLSVVAVQRSRLGRLLAGLADEPVALSTLGTSINVTRVIAVCISGFLAGVSGATYAAMFGAVSASSFSYVQSLVILAIFAISGRRTVRAAVVAPMLAAVLPAYTSNPDVRLWQQIGFGVAALFAAALSNSNLNDYLEARAAEAADRRVGPATDRVARRQLSEAPA